ncbi:DUF4232 domain-containing protein [Streptomyces sp. NPDC002537]
MNAKLALSGATATAIALSVGLATGAVAQGAPSTASSTAAAGLATCAAGDLGVSFADRLGGGMSHAGGTLEFRNTSGRECALRGYPGLGLENAQHQELSSHAIRGNTWYADDPGNKVVRIRPGGTAQAVVAWTHSGTEARQAAYLRVTPPAATAYRTIELGDLVDNGDLHITAVATTVPVRG